MRPLPLLAPVLLLALAAAGCIDAPDGDNDAGRQDGNAPSPTTPASGTDTACTAVAPETVNTGVSAGNSATVSNQPGAFSYSRQGAFAGTKDGYAWDSTSGNAALTASMQGAGSVKLAIHDACGKPLYEKTLSSGSDSHTETLQGTPGDWTIQFTYDAFSGNIGMSLSG